MSTGMRLRRLFVLTILAFALQSHQAGIACPFCSASQPTLSELIAKADVVAFASRVTPRNPDSATQSEQRVRFQLHTVVKGASRVPDRTLELDYFSKTSLQKSYMCMASGKERLRWSKPLALSSHSLEYMKKLPDLPKEGPGRVGFFLAYLEDEEEFLANDAYEEFARADYASVLALKPKLNRDELKEWIADPSIGANRRRLYLTLLGVCGNSADIPALKDMIVHRTPETKLLLDALFGCFITLSGESGVDFIETEFVGNPTAEYGHIYCAVLALRFHLESTDVVPKKRILVALSKALARPDCVHLVLPDLARMKDWSHIRSVERAFMAAEPKGWGRVSIIQYLKVCPKQEAVQVLKRLTELDPDAARRASLFPGATINKGKLPPGK